MKNPNRYYDSIKTINVLMFIVQSLGGRVKQATLHTLLYCADVLHLVRYGNLITGEQYLALKNGVIPVNTYYLFYQLAERKEKLIHGYNLKEYFELEDGFVTALQTYNSMTISVSAASSLFEVIRACKSNDALIDQIMTKTGEYVQDAIDISTNTMAHAGDVSKEMFAYILEHNRPGINHVKMKETTQTIKERKSLLSSIKAGTVLMQWNNTRQDVFIVVGCSILQYELVKVFFNDAININRFLEDLKKSFVNLNNNYDFLVDALVDCSKLFTLNFDEMHRWIQANSEGAIGVIEKYDVETILHAIQDNSTLPPIVKDAFLVY